MEYSVDSLTDKIKSLSVEVEHLSTQNSVLEKVLKLRNETIDKYQCINNVRALICCISCCCWCCCCCCCCYCYCCCCCCCYCCCYVVVMLLLLLLLLLLAPG